ncbi:NAD(P)H-dependent oxidoreductase [Acidimicrobium ferrooxidans]|uniref:NAD(P)H-dependent oxidoreductase n=1 Tax=Acidimicrobium ferrooxidans TaxID=53635 RepID=A0ABS3ANV3_9ACTN|nr:NAD(P)H-dependent oxidoreductase [Acidimicrobium ferrooxidans]
MMRVLVIDAYDPDDPDCVAADEAVATLIDGGHDVTRIELVAENFATSMSVAERGAYHQDENLVTAEVRRSAELIGQVDAVLFCYPTVTFTTPQILKAWLERVLLPGVAFVFDSAGRVRPGMTNIKRLGVVSTCAHGSRKLRRAGDGGRATILRAMRLSCNKFCRRTYIGMPSGEVDRAKIRKRLQRW